MTQKNGDRESVWGDLCEDDRARVLSLSYRDDVTLIEPRAGGWKDMSLADVIKRLAAALPCLMLFLFLSLSAHAQSTTTVSGSIKDLGTGVVSKSTFVRFTLQGCNGNAPRVNGTALIAPTQGAVYYKDFIPNASGAISGTLYSTRDAAGTGAGSIECGGSFTSVWYMMTPYVNGKAGANIPVHAKASSTLDISNVSAITTNPVVTAPTGDTTYARLDGGNQPFTAVVQVPNEIVTSLGVVKWGSSAYLTPDTGLSRTAAGTVAVGNGTQGDASGTIKANTLYAVAGITFGVAADATFNRVGANKIGIGPGAGTLETQVVQFDGATSGAVSVQAPAVAGSNLVTLPAATDTLVGKATTDIFTNKTYDTAGTGNVFKINGTQITAVTGTGSAVLATSPSITTPTITSPTINTGVAQGSGFKHQRFGATCTTGAAVNASCTSTYSWTSAFADANYTVVCVGDTNTNIPILESETHIAASVTVTIIANSAAAASFGAVDCIAIHD